MRGLFVFSLRQQQGVERQQKHNVARVISKKNFVDSKKVCIFAPSIVGA